MPGFINCWYKFITLIIIIVMLLECTKRLPNLLCPNPCMGDEQLQMCTIVQLVTFSLHCIVVFNQLPAGDLEVCLGSNEASDYILVNITSQVTFLF